MTPTVEPLPTQLTLYVNFPCNLECKNCYLFGIADYDRPYMGPGQTQEMSWEVLRAAVDPIVEAGRPVSVCVMGGEPLLHAEVGDFVSYLKQHPGVYVDINTNATIAPRRIERLVAGDIDAVYVSLDGSSAEVNDAGRGRNAFARAMRGLEYLLERRASEHPDLTVAINYTITNLNYLDLVAMAELSERLGVDELFFNLPTFVRAAEGEAARRAFAEFGYAFDSWRGFVIDEMVDGVDTAAFERELHALTRRSWPFRLYVQPVRYSPEELPSWFTHDWPRVMREDGCPIQGFRTTVLPGGDVVPCTVYPDLVVGNVLETPLPELWTGQRYQEFRRFVTSRLLPTCQRCCDLYDEASADPLAFVEGSRELHALGGRPDA